jgi:radical SAM superfamily enzyme YgiQ (UPF0313 family)
MTKMKANCVILFFPPAHGLDMEIPVTSLGGEILVEVLRSEGHDCTSIIVPLHGSDEDFINRLSVLNPDFVGLNLLSHCLEHARVVGQLLRDKLGPAVHISAGGYVATWAGEWLLENPGWNFLDSVVRGEAENIIGPLVDAVITGKPVHQIEGAATHQHPKSPTSFAPPVDDLDSLPWPARDSPEMNSAWIVTSRGCTEHCTFCSGPHAKNLIGTGKVFRSRSPENVVAEMEFLASKGVDTIRMGDATYEDPGEIGKQRIKRIAELIMERELRVFYHIHGRTHGWTEKDDDLLQLLHKSGLERVAFGIESGSDRVLELFKKRANVEDHRRAIRLFRKHDIDVCMGIIMFHPYTEWQDIEETAAFLASEGLGFDLVLHSCRLWVFPGTEIQQQLSADGLLEQDYRESLDPFAYRYVNPNIGRLAHVLVHLAHHCGSVQEFQHREKVLDIHLKRLRRVFGKGTEIREAMDEAEARVNKEKEALTKFNRNLLEDLIGYAKRGEFVPRSVGTTVEEHFDKAAREVKSAQLRLSVHLEDQEEDLQMGKKWWDRALGSHGFSKKHLDHSHHH